MTTVIWLWQSPSSLTVTILFGIAALIILVAGAHFLIMQK
jgi:hypothetical protein